MKERKGALAQPLEQKSTLPPLELFNSNFAYLNIDKEAKDAIYLWWKEVDLIKEGIAKFEAAINLPSVPSLEKKEAKKYFSEKNLEFLQINSLITGFIERPRNILKDTFVRPLQQYFSTPKEEQTAKGIYELIASYKEKDETFNEQIISLCEAVEETRDVNSSAEIMRQKIAQGGFEEIMTLFPYKKFLYQSEVGEEPSTIDAPSMEKKELNTVLSRPLWSGKEKRKYQSLFKKYRKMMDTLEFETEIKTGFNLIFKLAIGEASLTRNSAIAILEKVEEVWQGASNDETLAEVWDYELEEEQEDEDEE